MRPPYLSGPIALGLAALTLAVGGAGPARAATGGGGLGASAPAGPSGGGDLGARAPAHRERPHHARPRHDHPHRTRPHHDHPHRTRPHHDRPTAHHPRGPVQHIAVTPAPTAAPGQLVIAGAGDGHGIGMSQYGAEGYALHGATAPQILAHYYTGTALGATNAAQTVRVLIAQGHASFSGASSISGVALVPSQTYDLTAGAGGAIVCTNAATGSRVAQLADTATATGSGPLTTAGREYDGELQFTAQGSGGVQTVDAVGLDDYVRGVVAAEMPSSWAPAALEAQAIAARTYAITTTVDGNGYDLYDDTRSQMYGGVSAETPATDAAVAATAGEVVTYHGTPAVTYFFASSGGYTESIQNAWPGTAPEPWLQGVPDPYDGVAGNPEYTWTVRMSLAAATAKLGSLVDGTLERIVVTRRGVSPRVVSAQVVGSRGTTTVTGPQLAGALGLASTWMSFSVGA